MSEGLSPDDVDLMTQGLRSLLRELNERVPDDGSVMVNRTYRQEKRKKVRDLLERLERGRRTVGGGDA